jgi:transcriptional regulator GlxA family with amidase domain
VAELRRRYPNVQVVPDAIYTRDAQVWTSAGITAGMDLALAMVAADHGLPLALKVAKRMVDVDPNQSMRTTQHPSTGDARTHLDAGGCFGAPGPAFLVTGELRP